MKNRIIQLYVVLCIVLCTTPIKLVAQNRYNSWQNQRGIYPASELGKLFQKANEKSDKKKKSNKKKNEENLQLEQDDIVLDVNGEGTDKQGAITGVGCHQDGKNIIITYSLDRTANIEVWYSEDGGKTYHGPLKKVSGDVGQEISPGMKMVIWDVLAEVEKFVGTQIVFKVVSVTCHEAVDLGLSVKWASCNLGANRPEEYGDYFAWGEIKPKKDYSWSTYKWCKGELNMLTKYCNDSKYGYNRFNDGKTVLSPGDDAAAVNWSGMWRMPTYDEFKELILNCQWKATTLNGVYGIKLTSKKEGYTDKWIFLPLPGFRHESSLPNTGYGYYWSSSLCSPYPNYPRSAFYMHISSSGVVSYDYYRDRYLGFSVRPVSE